MRSKDFLNELDRYEGVPELYHRVKCNVNYKGKKIESWIYRPTDRTIEKLIKEIENLKEIDRKSIFNEDIWLRYLESEFPHVVKKYPELFMPIKSF
ncbi:MAG: gamma-glutamylcyclotransferase [Candidatus Helarchaeota archaeon]